MSRVAKLSVLLCIPILIRHHPKFCFRILVNFLFWYLFNLDKHQKSVSCACYSQ